MQMHCERCAGYGRLADHPCDACEGTGYVHACLNCASEPIDPLLAPFCSFSCKEAYAKATLDSGGAP